MRPVRAFAILSATLAVWSIWRFDQATNTYAAMLARFPKRTQALQERRTAQNPGVETIPSFAFSDAPALAGRLVAPKPASIPAADMVLAAVEPEAAAPVPTPATPRFEGAANNTAFTHAEAAYRALTQGNRRAAAKGFASALADEPRHPNAAAWRAELAALRRRWRIEAYSLVREGASGLVGDRPLLGGGQSGLRVGYTPDPLARRPAELFGRLAIAHDGLNPNSRSAQGAIGAAWMPLGRDGPAVGAERLVAIGREGRNAWALRISGGVWHAADARLPVDLSAYAEAGVVGARSRHGFAGAQASALYPVTARDGTRIGVGSGVWASVQDGGTRTASRLEIGPSAQVSQRIGKGTVELRGEYRFRIAGDATPGSGPALTVATRF